MNCYILKKTRQRGVIMVICALVLPIFLLLMGLAIDFGFMYVQRNKLQDVADATALAAASQISKESRYYGWSVDHEKAKMMVGKAVLDYLKENDSDFSGISIDEVAYKGVYRYDDGQGNVQEDSVDLDDTNNRFVKLMNLTGWTNPNAGPKMTASMPYKVEYAISGRLSETNFVDKNVDDNGNYVSDYTKDDRVRVRLTKRVPLLLLSTLLGEKYAKGVPLTVMAAAKAETIQEEIKNSEHPLIIATESALIGDLASPGSLHYVEGGKVDYKINKNGYSVASSGLFGAGYFIGSANINYTYSEELFNTLDHLYAIGKIGPGVQTTGAYIAVKGNGDNTFVSVDSYYNDYVYIKDDPANSTPFYEVVYGKDMQTWPRVTDENVLQQIRAWLDHKENMEYLGENVTENENVHKPTQGMKLYELYNKYPTVDVDKYIAGNNPDTAGKSTQRFLGKRTWDDKAACSKIANVNQNIISNGVDLYVAGSDPSALNNNNEIFASVDMSGIWCPVLTNRNLSSNIGIVDKVNTLHTMGDFIIATDDITYGDIYCQGNLYISGSNNVFKGNIFVKGQLRFLGVDNVLFAEKKDDQVGIVCTQLYLGNGAYCKITDNTLYVRLINTGDEANTMLYPYEPNYQFSLKFGDGSVVQGGGTGGTSAKVSRTLLVE